MSIWVSLYLLPVSCTLLVSGSLDIAGKNPSLGAPKIVSGIMTSLYLGFGLTLGSDVFLLVDRPARRAFMALAAKANPILANTVVAGSFTATNGTAPLMSGLFSFANTTADAAGIQSQFINGCFRDPEWPWYLQPIPQYALFILVPIFTFCSSMANGQHWFSKHMVVMVVIACVSFLVTRVANLYWGLQSHPDYVSLIGSFFVGLLGNGYSRRFGGTAFTSMLTGILLLVPVSVSFYLRD